MVATDTPTRRAALAAIGSGSLAALAGCTSSSGGSGGPSVQMDTIPLREESTDYEPCLCCPEVTDHESGSLFSLSEGLELTFRTVEQAGYGEAIARWGRSEYDRARKVFTPEDSKVRFRMEDTPRYVRVDTACNGGENAAVLLELTYPNSEVDG